ncbi:alpha amylase C-terminal domain-containing protein, partial [Akkermansiaceae bacterium]|nr:alpha amylase C-terminal domain-containing protein [Akkermansiaceae bacterium]
KVTSSAAFSEGEFYGLNHANKENAKFGRLDGESGSGHWTYAFLRSEQSEGGETCLVIVNLHPTQTFTDFSVLIPEHAREWANIDKVASVKLLLGDLGWEIESAASVKCSKFPPLSVQILKLSN